MTTQHQIIAFCVIAVIIVPLGSFIAIKTINKLTRTPVNTLVRPEGDIQMVDFIEPIRPGHIYQPLDIVNPNYMNYEPHN
jgi:hypothetical protein